MISLNSIDIQEEFYEEEIRSDYIVPQKLKKIWAVQLDLLVKYLKICEKYNIQTIVWAGTLLGAVRHSGFIPWDDDLDVAMTRVNYEKFLAVAEKELSYPYFLQNALSDREYFLGYSRLRNSETTGIIRGNESVSYNNGIYIDIYVLDGYADNKLADYFYVKVRNIYEKALQVYYSNVIPENHFKRYMKKRVKRFLNEHYAYEEIMRKYILHMKKYSGSDRVGLQTHVERFRNKYWCARRYLDDIVYSDFESIKVPVPENYDEILKNMYGDYMKFPPMDERGMWHQDSIIFEPDMSYKEYFKRNLNENGTKK